MLSIMKLSRLLIMAGFLLFGCDGQGDNDDKVADRPPPRPDVAANHVAFGNDHLMISQAPQIGDQVEALEDLVVYEQATTSSDVLGNVSAGTVGTMTNGPKLKDGVNWARVDWPEVSGLVLYDLIGIAGDDPPDDPPGDDPPTGAVSFFGAAGCSMTRDLFHPGFLLYSDILNGWEKTGSAGKVLKGYSGGGIEQWGKQSNVWGSFDRGVTSWPQTDAIIWQICIKEENISNGVDSYQDEIDYVADRIKSNYPNARLFVVAQPAYDGGHVCHTIGPDGWAFAEALADRAAATTYAEKIPLVLGPLDSSQVKDGCHANTSGIQEQVAQMETWFNSL